MFKRKAPAAPPAPIIERGGLDASLAAKRRERQLENEALEAHAKKKRKGILGVFLRTLFGVMAVCLAIDHYAIPFSQNLLGLGPGYSGRSPVLPGYISEPQAVPSEVPLPPWAVGQEASSESKTTWHTAATVHDTNGIDAMRAAGQLASRALAVAREMIQPGVTTDEIDSAVHRFIVSQQAYPSPLNFKGFPKSVCTSVNEVMVHGIPDSRPLEEGDIINVDVTVYHRGVNADTSATFQVGNTSRTAFELMSATRRALEAAVEACGPGRPLKGLGEAVQAVAESAGMSPIRMFVGHGIGAFFHGKPKVYAFAPTGWWDLAGWMQLSMAPDYWSTLKPGMTFTIEPILVEPGGSTRVRVWDDKWTVATTDGALSAQFEYTVLVQEPGEEEGQGGCEVLTPYLWEQTTTEQEPHAE